MNKASASKLRLIVNGTIQWPNLPLKIAIIGWLIHRWSDSWLQSGSQVVYLGALIVWASWEIVSGTNWFRRVLGLVVLFLTIGHVLRLI